ncbi:hypothetical protein B0H14DRAFT_2605509 [Mycena olivaceomarginata]|nr:hypothetical protein B0H14DRAFT_2605509 [Mycena olivaceomarginata]
MRRATAVPGCGLGCGGRIMQSADRREEKLDEIAVALIALVVAIANGEGCRDDGVIGLGLGLGFGQGLGLGSVDIHTALRWAEIQQMLESSPGLVRVGRHLRDGDSIRKRKGWGRVWTVEAALSANGTAYRTIIPRAIETPLESCCVLRQRARDTGGGRGRPLKNKRMSSGGVGVRDTWSGVVSTDRTVQAQTKEMDVNVERWGTAAVARPSIRPARGGGAYIHTCILACGPARLGSRGKKRNGRRNETEDETQNETKRPVQFTPSALHRDEIKANHKKEKEY